MPDCISDEFLHRLFQGTRSECLVNTPPDEKLERLVGDRKIETRLAEPGKFLG